MSLRSYRTFQALILAGSGLGLLVLVLDGHVVDYIHPSLGFLVFIAALVMIVLAQFVLRERPSEAESGQHLSGDRPGWGLWLAALPLLVGLLIPDPHFAAGVDPIPRLAQTPLQLSSDHRSLSFSPMMFVDVPEAGLTHGNFWMFLCDSGFGHFRAVECSPLSIFEIALTGVVPEPPYRNP